MNKGGELRRPRAAGKRSRKCPNCHRVVDVKGAKFCPYCGEDIRDEKDLLIEKVGKLFGLLGLLPANSRDEAQQIIIEFEAYLKKN